MTTCAHGGSHRTAALALVAFAAATAWLPAAAAAAPASSVRYGTPVTFLQPQSAAMGGTGTALYRGGLSNVLNPATLAREMGTRFDGTLSVAETHEDRFVPLFDTFESYVVDIAVATNRHSYLAGGLGIARRLSPLGGLALGLSLTERYDFDYDFREEVRNPSTSATPDRDALLQDRKVEVDGALRALSLGVGREVFDLLALGASVHYTFGTREEVRGRRFYATPALSTLEQGEFEMDGVNFTLGSQLRIGERIEIGLAWETPLTVDGDTRTETVFGTSLDSLRVVTGEAKVRYPNRWRAGVAFFPRSDPRTVFTVEAELSQWSELEDDRLTAVRDGAAVEAGEVLLFEDTIDTRIGVEHLFYNGFQARFGFRHVDDYADREVSQSMFTGGIGWPIAGGDVSLSVEIGKMQSVEAHWFDYPAGYVAPPDARVETTLFRIGAGYTLAF